MDYNVDDILFSEFGIPVMPVNRRHRLRERAQGFPETYNPIVARLSEVCNMEPENERLEVGNFYNWIEAHEPGPEGGFEVELEETGSIYIKARYREIFEGGETPWVNLDTEAQAEGWAFAKKFNEASEAHLNWLFYLAALIDARQVCIMFKLSVALCMEHDFNELPRGRVSRV